jgi:hypothetical protein
MHTHSTVRPSRATRLRSGANADPDMVNADSDLVNADSDMVNADSDLVNADSDMVDAESDDASCTVRDRNSRPCGCAFSSVRA